MTTVPSPSSVDQRVRDVIEIAKATRGFMPENEGLALFAAAERAGEAFAERGAVFVEIGAWCGKSSLYLGAAAEATSAVLFSIDHHHGSEENQAGWEHHDADLESSVVGLVGDSPTVSSRWTTPLAFCFIDGGHGEEPAWADYRGWAPHVVRGGWLAIHDVFPDPADGGRPPYDIWRAALDSGEFAEDGACGSLRVLRRI